MLSSMGRPMSLSPRSKLGSKYSSGVMAVGLVAVAYSRVRSYQGKQSHTISCWGETKCTICKWLLSTSYSLCTYMLLHGPQQRLQNVPLTCKQNNLISLLLIQFVRENMTLTFNPRFLFICKMLCPRPDDYIYIVYTEDLIKKSKPYVRYSAALCSVAVHLFL